MGARRTSAATIGTATGANVRRWRRQSASEARLSSCAVHAPMTAAIACCTVATVIGYGKFIRIAFVVREVTTELRYHTSTSTSTHAVEPFWCHFLLGRQVGLSPPSSSIDDQPARAGASHAPLTEPLHELSTTSSLTQRANRVDLAFYIVLPRLSGWGEGGAAAASHCMFLCRGSWSMVPYPCVQTSLRQNTQTKQAWRLAACAEMGDVGEPNPAGKGSPNNQPARPKRRATLGAAFGIRSTAQPFQRRLVHTLRSHAEATDPFANFKMRDALPT